MATEQNIAEHLPSAETPSLFARLILRFARWLCPHTEGVEFDENDEMRCGVCGEDLTG